ncbi:MAG: YdcF family protein [Bacteroidia bacterium]|nr:YdcF family protein [Bacteroidia bacterium]
MKKALKKWGIRLGIFLVMVFAVYLLRRPILRGAGSFLAKTDVPVKVDAAFVLSGAAKERTIRALELYPEFAPQLVTTGGMVAQALQALGMTYTGSEVMRDALLMGGVDSSHVNIIPRGTSTFEESEEILGYCLAQGYHRVMIVSSLHHTRRIGHVFRDKFRDAGIEVNVQGADPIEYRADQWWLDEDGLIFVVNEYAKILYYVWRY